MHHFSKRPLSGKCKRAIQLICILFVASLLILATPNGLKEYPLMMGRASFGSFDPLTSEAGTDTLRKLKLIFDTDIAEDCDDVGAMAVLHALADKGELDILGMMVSMPVHYGAPALDAINTYFNRPDIPNGTLKNSHDSTGARNLDVYNRALAEQFENDLKHAYNTPNALDLYRELLSKEPDQSVVILTVGPLTNLYHLMRSAPDQHSPLSGMDLIRKKVKRFIMAGGRLPEGSSYNFRIAPDKSEYVINHWPTEHWLVPNQLGDSVFTGREMLANTTAESPIHTAYALYEKAHPGWEFRPSWDQMGVYIAARSDDPLFKIDSTGSVVAKKHFISWRRYPDKDHLWFQNNASREERRKTIEALMMYQP
jgi:inosine-uridine nucleoside N-ribohydrolase